MKRLILVGALFLMPLSGIADERKVYETGWTDGFKAGYSMKEAQSIRIPAGFWLYADSKRLPMELVAFYLWIAQRYGLKPYWTDEEVIFHVFEREADALRYKNLFEGLGIENLVVTRKEGKTGYEGGIKVIDRAKYEGLSGVIHHLKKAIESAEEIDPTVLNRDLLVKDLREIFNQIEKWKERQKGYRQVIPEETKPAPEIIKKFLEEGK